MRMTISRQRALAGLAAAALPVGLPFRAGAAEFTFKLGLNTPTTHPQTVRFLEAARNIRSNSGGRLEVQVFPNGTLGNETSMVTQVRAGAIEMYSGANGQFAELAPAAQLDGIPFIFADARAADKALDGGLGDYIRKAIAATGLYPLPAGWDFGFKQFISSRPVRSPGDIKGLKVGTRAAQLSFTLWQSLGATPVSMGLAELYTALQTKLADGADQTLGSVENSKFYEVTKFLAITNHQWNGYTCVVNGDAFRKLPKDLQAILERDTTAAAHREREDIAKIEAAYPEKLQSQGMAVTKMDSAAFQAAIKNAGFYAQWREKFGPEAWHALERSVGHALA